MGRSIWSHVDAVTTRSPTDVDGVRDGSAQSAPEFPIGQPYRGFLPADAERFQVGRKIFSSRPRLAGFALCGARVEHGDRLTRAGHTTECEFGRVALRGLELNLDALAILVAVESIRAIWDGYNITTAELRERVRKPDGTRYSTEEIRAAESRGVETSGAGFGNGYNYPGMCAQGRMALEGLRVGRSVAELRAMAWPAQP